MDIETALREHLTERADKPDISIWLNNEGRVVLLLLAEDKTQKEFVAVGNSLLPYPVVASPATQSVAIDFGIDAHGPMGAR